MSHEKESHFGIEELFFSITDRKGIIESGNDVFIRISQYSWSQLYKKPHNIIRHPDMPKAVFWLLWDTILKGEPIAAYVKNRAKDGSFYWVTALVIPVGKYFLSVRLKPTSPILGTVKALYQQMLKKEKEEGIPKALDLAVTALQGLGFKSYRDFMFHALKTELREHTKAVHTNEDLLHSFGGDTQDVRGQIKQMLPKLRGSFALFEKLTSTMAELDKQAALATKFSSESRLLGMNASTASQRFGSQGKTLSVVADQIQLSSDRSKAASAQMTQMTQDAAAAIARAEFEVGATLLQVEVADSFFKELEEKAPEGELKERMNFSIDMLGKAVGQGCLGLAEQLEACRRIIMSLKREGDNLQETISASGIVVVTGRVEAASANFTQFLAILKEFETQLKDASTLAASIRKNIIWLNQTTDELSLVQQEANKLSAYLGSGDSTGEAVITLNVASTNSTE